MCLCHTWAYGHFYSSVEGESSSPPQPGWTGASGFHSFPHWEVLLHAIYYLSITPRTAHLFFFFFFVVRFLFYTSALLHLTAKTRLNLLPWNLVTLRTIKTNDFLAVLTLSCRYLLLSPVLSGETHQILDTGKRREEKMYLCILS